MRLFIPTLSVRSISVGGGKKGWVEREVRGGGVSVVNDGRTPSMIFSYIRLVDLK